MGTIHDIVAKTEPTHGAKVSVTREKPGAKRAWTDPPGPKLNWILKAREGEYKGQEVAGVSTLLLKDVEFNGRGEILGTQVFEGIYGADLAHCKRVEQDGRVFRFCASKEVVTQVQAAWLTPLGNIFVLVEPKGKGIAS